MVRWLEWGPVAAPAVVCVHGLTRNARDFDPLAQALAARGRRVICPDVPGRGLSDWLPPGVPYAVPTYLAALAPLLAGLGEVDWVGTSLGGLIGMGQCTVPGTRIRRLVLNDVGPFVPAVAVESLRDRLTQAPADFVSIPAFEAHLRRAQAGFGALSDTQWEHMAQHSARMTPAGRVVPHHDPALLAPLLARKKLADVDLFPLWPLVAQRPVLVLRGEDSDLLLPDTAARMADLPGVRVETIAGCGHAPALMDAAQIALVAGFLAG